MSSETRPGLAREPSRGRGDLRQQRVREYLPDLPHVLAEHFPLRGTALEEPRILLVDEVGPPSLDQIAARRHERVDHRQQQVESARALLADRVLHHLYKRVPVADPAAGLVD